MGNTNDTSSSSSSKTIERSLPDEKTRRRSSSRKQPQHAQSEQIFRDAEFNSEEEKLNRGRRLSSTSLSNIPSLGKNLFRKATDQAPTHSPNGEKQDLAEFGAQVLLSGMTASSKIEIQKFANEFGKTCADCVDNEDEPKWCVLNFGVFVCSDCAGIHRSFPISIHGGVRSLILDDWTDEMTKSVIKHGGNDTVNSVLEYHVPVDIYKPRHNVSRTEDRRKYIEDKYVKQLFKNAGNSSPRKPNAAKAEIRLQKSSFSAGKESMVGVIDVTVLNVENLPHSLFQFRHLNGGFTLKIELGRFEGTSPSSISGRKWINYKAHLSWNGLSPLKLTILTGNKKLVGETTYSLEELNRLNTKSFSTNIVVDIPLANKFDCIDPISSPIPELSRVILKIDFVDLR